jgi:hypothetical protein
MASVYLSYSHWDKAFARRLAADLSKSGLRVWMDESGLKIGDDFAQKAREGIKQADYFAVLMSSHSVKSQSVLQKIELALKQESGSNKPKILPLLIEDCTLPAELQGRFFGDFRQSLLYEESLRKLLDSMGAKTPAYHPGVDAAPAALQAEAKAVNASHGYLVWLIAGIVLVILYGYRVTTLPPGAQNQIFYVVLLFAATACAIALFTGLGSGATITYRRHGIGIRLGGAAALFAAIVYGGFKIVPTGADTFDLTLRAHSADGTEPIISSGKVTIDLDNDRRTEGFGPDGEAEFKGIPGRFRGATVSMLPQVEGYQAVWQRHKIQWTAFDLALEPAVAARTTLTGSIMAPADMMKSLRVAVEGQKPEAKCDDLGKFELPVEGKSGDRVRLRVYAGRRLVYDDYQTLPGPVTLQVPRLQVPE